MQTYTHTHFDGARRICQTSLTQKLLHWRIDLRVMSVQQSVYNFTERHSSLQYALCRSITVVSHRTCQRTDSRGRLHGGLGVGEWLRGFQSVELGPMANDNRHGQGLLERPMAPARASSTVSRVGSARHGSLG